MQNTEPYARLNERGKKARLEHLHNLVGQVINLENRNWIWVKWPDQEKPWREPDEYIDFFYA